VCTNFTPTKEAKWAKDALGIDIPVGYADESYPTHNLKIGWKPVMQMHMP
jgi:hypothetical protein